MAKKLTLEEFDRRVKEALTGTLQNGTRRSQPGRVGIIKDLLKGKNGGVSPQQERIVNGSKST